MIKSLKLTYTRAIPQILWLQCRANWPKTPFLSPGKFGFAKKGKDSDDLGSNNGDNGNPGELGSSGGPSSSGSQVPILFNKSNLIKDVRKESKQIRMIYKNTTLNNYYLENMKTLKKGYLPSILLR